MPPRAPKPPVWTVDDPPGDVWRRMDFVRRSARRYACAILSAGGDPCTVADLAFRIASDLENRTRAFGAQVLEERNKRRAQEDADLFSADGDEEGGPE